MWMEPVAYGGPSRKYQGFAWARPFFVARYASVSCQKRVMRAWTCGASYDFSAAWTIRAREPRGGASMFAERECSGQARRRSRGAPGRDLDKGRADGAADERDAADRRDGVAVVVRHRACALPLHDR